MLSKRGVALSADKAFAKRIAAGLMAAGANVETAASLDQLQPGPLHADIVVVHVTGDLRAVIATASAHTTPGTPLVAIIASSSLEDMVAVMQSGRVASVMVADHFSPAQLSGVAARLLYGDLFGLEKVVSWGVKVYSLLVGDYQEKSIAIGAVSDFAEAMGVRRKYRESIEQCLDEMLMNALYDAPVDAATGKQTFAEVPTKTRISLRMEQKVVVQYACDGNRFALSVRDAFGTLKGETVVHYLDKCLHSEQQIDRKVGGAGLGLFLICNAATEFLVNLHPGVATEATCLFDLTAPKVQLEQFGVFDEKIDSSARLFGGPTRLVTSPGFAAVAPPAGRGVTALLAVAVVLLLALIGVVAYPRLRPTPRGAVAITSTPPGATVEVDGVAKGTTGAEPVVIPDLEVGQKYKLIARRPGYDSAVELISPQKAKETTSFDLTLRPLAASLVINSTPSGATLLLDGKEAGTTPVTLSTLAPGSDHQAELRKLGYQDQVRAVHVPDPGGSGEVQFVLSLAPEVSSIRIDSEPPGAEVLQNGELLAGVRTPVAEHIVQAGKAYAFTFRLPGYMPETRTVSVQQGAPASPLSVQLKPGGTLTLETNLGEAKITVMGVNSCQRVGTAVECPVENGSYKVKLSAPTAYIGELFTVDMKGADVHRKIDLGFVATGSDDLALKVPGAPPNTHKVAFSEGDHQITLVEKNGVDVRRSVKVTAGKTVTLGSQKAPEPAGSAKDL